MKSPTIINNTTYDGRIVNGIIRYVFRHLELTGTGVVVKVGYTKWGGAYSGRCHVSNWKGTVINVRISPPSSYPQENHVYDRRDSPGTWLIETWQHALVAVTAHEGMHLRQWRKRPTGPRKRGLFNEVETEWAAKRIHDAWAEERCRKA